jgi:hypothetical protein
MKVPAFTFRAGLGYGVLIFLGLLLILLVAGDLSASKFIYVDF